MTGYLQMLDLVVNGPIKNHLRNQRALVIYNAFQEHIAAYYAEHDKTDEEGREEVRFRPPKPNMLDAIQQLFKLFADDGYFQTEDLKNSMSRTMVKTGCCCMNDVDPRSFVQYNDSMVHSNAACVPMNLIPLGTRSALVPIRGTVQQDIETAELTARVMETLQAMLDKGEYSEDDNSDSEDVDSDEESGSDTDGSSDDSDHE